jgi:hypothetical protein
MAFSAICTIALLLSKIIFRFLRHPEQLAMMRAPMVISQVVSAVAVWDAGERLPRQTLRRGPLPPQDRRAATERLLDLLSPATFVEAPLLRAVRQLVRGADA